MRARNPVTGRFVKAVDPSEEKALTAAVAVLPANQLDRMPRASEPWQERAVRLWRVLGVLHYPTSFMAEQVQRIGWNVEVDGTELEPEAAEKAMEAVTSPMSVAEASRRLALNLEVLGEVYYYRKSDEWNVLAPTVAKKNEILKAADIRIREWIADFVDADKPDSPVRAALDIAEEIRVLSNLSRSQSRNRVAQRGILLIPKEGQFPENDPFKGTLEASMTAPIADEYSPSAVVPPVVDYPADYIEKWRHLLLEYPYDEKLDAKIDNAIKRLALSLNMPPEVLLGNIDSSHWNAWLSEESTYRAHIEPLAVMVGEVYAKAMMEAVDGAVSVKVTPDPSELLARRQSVADSFEALRLGVVGFEYVRRQIGADDADAPTPEEIDLILRLMGHAPVTEVPAVGTGSTDVGPPQLPSGNGQVPAPVSPNGNGVTAAVDPDASDEELDTLARRLTDMDFRLLSVLQGLAEMSVMTARDRVEADQVGAQEAVADEMQRLGNAWGRELTQARKALKQLGIDASGPEWDEAQDASVGLLFDEMTAFITDNLGKTDSEAPSLPVLTLRRVLATAGGSGSATVAAVSNPAPTFQDPQGFALGVLPLKALKGQDIQLINWKFRYGPLHREHPFLEHKAVDGQFMTSDGRTSQGWYPGDHGGCECGMTPVFRKVRQPRAVAKEVGG